MRNSQFRWLAFGLAITLISCDSTTNMKTYQDIQLTDDDSGHHINSTQAFSPDNQWVAYDSRNEKTGINEAGEVAMVNVNTGEIKTLYRTENQTEFGPGLGAVTFSPVENTVLFIHGIRNASEQNPYSMTRRTGVAIQTANPQVPLFLDARDMTAPFTAGALRGGTHAHTWSGDGKWISYTYNDYLIEQAEKAGKSVKDLRTIGVMIPGESVKVSDEATLENNNGELFSTLIVNVVDEPKPGTDEVDKAFDECFVGKDGYIRTDGSKQTRAVAYQGNVRDINGKTVTQIFVADLPDDLLELAKVMPISADPSVRLPVSDAIKTRRITNLENGVSPAPRHWLRSSSDGKFIGFLSKDANEIIQFFVVSPNGGEAVQVTNHEFSIDSPFNFSSDGTKVAYIADGSVFITEVASRKSQRVTEKAVDDRRPVISVVWSNDDTMLAYNRLVKKGYS